MTAFAIMISQLAATMASGAVDERERKIFSEVSIDRDEEDDRRRWSEKRIGGDCSDKFNLKSKNTKARFFLTDLRLLRLLGKT